MNDEDKIICRCCGRELNLKWDSMAFVKEIGLWQCSPNCWAVAENRRSIRQWFDAESVVNKLMGPFCDDKKE